MRCLLLFIICLVFLNPVQARPESLPGPIKARLIRVIDGDTVVAEISPWFGQRIEVSVRLEGINAPELNSRCAQERERAELAREFLQSHLSGHFMMYNVRKGKYFGRVIARLQTDDNQDIAKMLIAAGMAEHYLGGIRIVKSC